jgi:geranylgeranyl diphosphate synthase type II
MTSFQEYLYQTYITTEPQSLYEPANYMLSLGGKRLRPLVCLAACELFGGKAEQALPAAAAVEWFHNFTLVHDDVMDKAENTAR